MKIGLVSLGFFALSILDIEIPVTKIDASVSEAKSLYITEFDIFVAFL